MLIRVLVKPESKKERFEETASNRFEIDVKEKKKNNQANRRVIELIAKNFKVTRNKVRIMTGHKGQRKTMEVDLG